MADEARKSGNTQPQYGFRHDKRQMDRARWLADHRDERDRQGNGLSVVMRAAVDRYVKRYYDQLPDDLRD